MVDAEDLSGTHGEPVRPFVLCPDETVEGGVYGGVAVEDGDEVFAYSLGVPVGRGLFIFWGTVVDGDTVWRGVRLNGGDPRGTVGLREGAGVEGIGRELNQRLGRGHCGACSCLYMVLQSKGPKESRCFAFIH